MLQPEQVIKEYRITEKSGDLSANLNKYTFEVNPNVNRTQVAKAVEALFEVEVAKVNILKAKAKTKRSRTQRGKTGKTANIKKAIVTLKSGSAIDLV